MFRPGKEGREGYSFPTPGHGGCTEKHGVAGIVQTINPKVPLQPVKHTYLSEVISRHKAGTGNGKGSSVLQPQARTVTTSRPRHREWRPRARRTERALPAGAGPQDAQPLSVTRRALLLDLGFEHVAPEGCCWAESSSRFQSWKERLRCFSTPGAIKGGEEERSVKPVGSEPQWR